MTFYWVPFLAMIGGLAAVFGAVHVLFTLPDWAPALYGLKFPDPVVGQVWRARLNGELIRVSEVLIDVYGNIHVGVQHQYEKSPDGWGVPDHYAFGLRQWRKRLRDERREPYGRIFLEKSALGAKT